MKRGLSIGTWCLLMTLLSVGCERKPRGIETLPQKPSPVPPSNSGSPDATEDETPGEITPPVDDPSTPNPSVVTDPGTPVGGDPGTPGSGAGSGAGSGGSGAGGSGSGGAGSGSAGGGAGSGGSGSVSGGGGAVGGGSVPGGGGSVPGGGGSGSVPGGATTVTVTPQIVSGGGAASGTALDWDAKSFKGNDKWDIIPE